VEVKTAKTGKMNGPKNNKFILICKKQEFFPESKMVVLVLTFA
jgi:hypothetical protein